MSLRRWTTIGGKGVRHGAGEGRAGSQRGEDVTSRSTTRSTAMIPPLQSDAAVQIVVVICLSVEHEDLTNAWRESAMTS
eukprot:8080709-Heterocapsa_arctica.AAC.1